MKIYYDPQKDVFLKEAEGGEHGEYVTYVASESVQYPDLPSLTLLVVGREARPSNG